MLAQGKQQEHVASSWRARELLAAATRGCYTSSMSVGYAVFPLLEGKQKGALDKIRLDKIRCSVEAKGAEVI